MASDARAKYEAEMDARNPRWRSIRAAMNANADMAASKPLPAVPKAKPKAAPHGAPIVHEVPSEHEEQKHLVQYLRARKIDHHSTPNEGKRSVKLMAMLRAAGFRTGHPDLTIDAPIPCDPRRRLHIELKRSDKRGQAEAKLLSSKQVRRVEKLRALGDVVLVCCGAREAIAQFEGVWDKGVLP